MIRNYLKIAFRNLWKYRLLSFVNIFGLALSMAIGLVLLNEIKKTFDYDTFHPHIENTYRVITTANSTMGRSKWATTPAPLKYELETLPEIDEIVQLRMMQGGRHIITDKGNVEALISFTEPEFFDLFGFKLSAGNAISALKSPNNVLLNEKLCSKLFGERNPIGEIITIAGLGNYTVAGIIQTPPFDSHIELHVVLSDKAIEALTQSGSTVDLKADWSAYTSVATYLKLNSAIDISNLQNKLSQISTQLNKQPALKKINYQFDIQPIAQITPWNPTIKNDYHAGMNWTGIWTIIVLVTSITLFASFNYVSLAVARSLNRAKEVGVRKSSGARRWQIITQFLVESIVLTMCALLVAIPMIGVSMNFNWFNIADHLQLNYSHWKLWIWVLSYAFLTGIISGLLPAWLLSSFKPIEVLRRLQNIRLIGKGTLYKSLTIIQFGVSMALVIFLYILRDTLIATSKTDWGFSTDNTLVIEVQNKDLPTVKEQIANLNGVVNVGAMVGNSIKYSGNVCKISTAQKGESLHTTYFGLDAHALKLFDIKLAAGNNFPLQTATTSEQYVLVNEAAARYISPSSLEKTIGKILWINDTVSVQISGVLKGFRPMGPHWEASRPIIIRYLPQQFNALHIKTTSAQHKQVRRAIAKIWDKNFSPLPAKIYSYEDELSDSAAGNSILELFQFWTVIILIIACLGLLGMVSYTLEVRTKELSVRIILGANTTALIWLISKNFIKILLLSAVLGLPLGWFGGFLIAKKLGNEVTQIEPISFILGFSIIFIIGLITILSQSWRVSNINPVKSLKTE